MSSENLNEVIAHDSCHSDEITEHIDDESQQEYAEKWAPKAQEELLNINHDSDSSPTHVVQNLNHNNEEAHKTDTITSEQQESDEIVDEVEVLNNNEDAYVSEETSDDVKAAAETPADENTAEELKEQEEIVVDDEEKEEKHELCVNEEVCDEEQSQKTSEIPIETELKTEINECKVEECEPTEIQLDEELVDETNIEEEKEHQNLEQCSVESIEITKEESDKEEKSVEDSPVKTSSPKHSGEKVSEDKRSKDIKNLSTSYNNDDTVNGDCEICSKTVYPLEKVSANNHIFHKQCFRCNKCRCALLVGNFSFNNNKPYCRPHYIELFKKRGRYDEIDNDAVAAQQTNISDILTDELPAPDITKNLLAKFRDLEAGTAAVTISATNAEVHDELPARNTTKNLTERFTALGKDSDKGEQKRKPMIEIPRSEESGHNNGDCENQPICLPKDVIRANEPGQDEMPEQGITKNLVNRFRDMENTGVASK